MIIHGITNDDEFSELLDANLPRVDLVKAPANGTPRFLIAKQDQSAGVLDPDYIRDLIAKSPEPSRPEPSREVTMPQTTLPNGITLTGSPADMAAFIHKATERQAPEVAETAKALAEYDAVIKAKYSAEDKRKMLSQGHAIKNENGDPSYPIGDKDDLGKAIRAVGRGGKDHDRIRAYVIRRAKALGAASEIPDNWNADGSLKDSVSKEDAVAAVTKDAGDALDEATDDGVDGLDPTVPAAEPDGDAPGDPADPGSSAWEAVDSATAAKWCMIISGAKRAVCWLKDREMLEAATADPDDAENACDLDMVCDALDYVISVLAPYAVSEQSESDRLAFEADVAKSAEPGSVLGAAVMIAKAGRVLSSANESRIRQASQHLNDVLASLPQASDGGPAAVTKEEGAVPGTETPADDVAKETAPDAEAPEAPEAAGDVAKAETQEPAETAPETPVAKSAPVAILYDAAGDLLGVAPSDAVTMRVAKASGDGEKQPMTAVFDADGNLIGIVDPSAITPVAGAGKKDEPKPDDGGSDDANPDDSDGKEGKPQPGPAAAAAADLEPQPSADAGTAPDDDAAGDDDPDNVAKATGPGAEENTAADVLKSIESAVLKALETQEAAHQEAITKMRGEQAEVIEALKKRLETVEAQPAAPKVFSNGQVPPAHQLRGQDQGAAPVDVAKARELKGTLYRGTATEQNAAFNEMQQMAVDKLAAMQATRR